MKTQEDILWEKLLKSLKDSLNYSLFHCKLDSKTDLMIYEVIHRFAEIERIRDKEVSEDLFGRLVQVIELTEANYNSELSSLKYYSFMTQERIGELIQKLKEGNLSPEESDAVLDNLTVHMYKLNILKQ